MKTIAVAAVALSALCGCRMVPEITSEFTWVGTVPPVDKEHATLKAQGECTIEWMEKVNFREASTRVATFGALIVDAKYSHPLALAVHLLGRYNLSRDFKSYIKACMATKGYKPLEANGHEDVLLDTPSIYF